MGKMFKEILIAKGILALEFRTFTAMRQCFLRAQEHAEHKHFKGKVFTERQYLKWCLQHEGNANPSKDWVGCALPTSDLKPFIDNRFSPLTEHESLLVDATKRSGLGMRGSVIGYIKGQNDDLKHEMAHAFYSLSRDYKRQVGAILKRYIKAGTRARINAVLKDLGYARGRYRDETHAYIIDGIKAWDALTPEGVKPLKENERREFARAKKALTKLYDQELKARSH